MCIILQKGKLAQSALQLCELSQRIRCPESEVQTRHQHDPELLARRMRSNRLPASPLDQSLDLIPEAVASSQIERVCSIVVDAMHVFQAAFDSVCVGAIGDLRVACSSATDSCFVNRIQLGVETKKSNARRRLNSGERAASESRIRATKVDVLQTDLVGCGKKAIKHIESMRVFAERAVRDAAVRVEAAANQPQWLFDVESVLDRMLESFLQRISSIPVIQTGSVFPFVSRKVCEHETARCAFYLSCAARETDADVQRGFELYHRSILPLPRISVRSIPITPESLNSLLLLSKSIDKGTDFRNDSEASSDLFGAVFRLPRGTTLFANRVLTDGYSASYLYRRRLSTPVSDCDDDEACSRRNQPSAAVAAVEQITAAKTAAFGIAIDPGRTTLHFATGVFQLSAAPPNHEQPPPLSKIRRRRRRRKRHRSKHLRSFVGGRVGRNDRTHDSDADAYAAAVDDAVDDADLCDFRMSRGSGWWFEKTGRRRTMAAAQRQTSWLQTADTNGKLGSYLRQCAQLATLEAVEQHLSGLRQRTSLRWNDAAKRVEPVSSDSSEPGLTVADLLWRVNSARSVRARAYTNAVRSRSASDSYASSLVEQSLAEIRYHHDTEATVCCPCLLPRVCGVLECIASRQCLCPSRSPSQILCHHRSVIFFSALP